MTHIDSAPKTRHPVTPDQVIALRVDGDPYAKGWKLLVFAEALFAMSDREPLSGHLHLTLTFTVAEECPVDYDALLELAAGVKDSVTEVLWTDAQITQCHLSRQYGENVGVFISVEPAIDGAGA